MIVKSLDVVGSSIFTNSLLDTTMQDGSKRERSIIETFLTNKDTWILL